jgi:hypothetical protein
MSNDNDEFAGQGGSYLVDKDGKRQLVHRTEAPKPEDAAKEPAALAGEQRASTKPAKK